MGTKLNKFFVKKNLLLAQATSLVAKSCLCFWPYLLLQTDFSSDCIDRKWNELKKRFQPVHLFFQTWIQNCWGIICCRKIWVCMCKRSVYFSAPPLSASASSLWLLWRWHWAQCCCYGGRRFFLWNTKYFAQCFGTLHNQTNDAKKNSITRLLTSDIQSKWSDIILVSLN